MGNGEAKEIIGTTYGHELRGGMLVGGGGAGRVGIKERVKYGCKSASAL